MQGGRWRHHLGSPWRQKSCVATAFLTLLYFYREYALEPLRPRHRIGLGRRLVILL